MSETPKPAASGLQIAFLIFAVLLLAAPADKYLFSTWYWANDWGLPVGRVAIFVVVGATFLAIPALRRYCSRLLSIPIPPTQRREVVLVILLHYVAAFGAIGALALYWWSTGGEPALARRMGEGMTAAEQWRRAFTVNGMVTAFIAAGILAPIVEEIVFRGMLYPTWKERLGWVASALATSVVFAVFHERGIGVSQFLASILFICLVRRTGSLRASIYAHAVFNISMWYPFLGQFLFPAGRETGELSVWVFHLACLAATCVAIPTYMWMARDPNLQPPSEQPIGAAFRT